MAAAIVAALALVAGCFSPSYKSGDLQCAPSGACPPGFHCDSGRCYRAGDGPDLAGGGGGGGGDGGISDGGAGTPDLAPPIDMAPIVVPPAATFVSCGGGASAAASGATLNLSFPGIAFGGTSTAASGAAISYGYFSNASVQ